MTARRRAAVRGPEPCACDACADQLGLGDAVTAEGLCGFCARRCFPMALVDGVPTRAPLSLDTRKMLHAHVATAAAPADPMAAAMAELARQGAPLLEQAVRRGIGAFLKGRRR